MPSNNWFLSRSKLLAKYAEELPKNIKHIKVLFDKPEYGWINAHFSINNNEMTFLEFSSVYEPFVDIIAWLERIYSYRFEVSILRIDCEGYEAELCYEPILYYDYNKWKGHGHYTEYGIFYIYETSTDEITLDAFCHPKDLVKSFYNAIIDYAKEMQNDDDFIDHWVWDAYNGEMGTYNEDSPELKDFFLDKVRSEIIEDYIKNGVEPRYEQIR